MMIRYDTKGRLCYENRDGYDRYPIPGDAMKALFLVGRQLRDLLRENKAASARELRELTVKRIRRLQREARKAECKQSIQPFTDQMWNASTTAINTDRRDVFNKLSDVVKTLHPGLDPV